MVLMLNEQMYVSAGSDARLVHDEHGPIDIPEGSYKVVRQREYTEPKVKKKTKIVWEYISD